MNTETACPVNSLSIGIPKPLELEEARGGHLINLISKNYL